MRATHCARLKDNAENEETERNIFFTESVRKDGAVSKPIPKKKGVTQVKSASFIVRNYASAASDRRNHRELRVGDLI